MTQLTTSYFGFTHVDATVTLLSGPLAAAIFEEESATTSAIGNYEFLHQLFLIFLFIKNQHFLVLIYYLDSFQPKLFYQIHH